MSVRLLLFGDTHLGFDLALRPRVERVRRGPSFFAALDRVLESAQALRVDGVVHGGDVFFRSKVPGAIVDRVYARLHRFLDDTRIPLFVVPGNHERSRLPPSLFLHHPLLRVFDAPRAYALDVRGVRVHLAGFPYQHGVRARFPALQQALLTDARDSDAQLLCCHHAFEGACVGVGDGREHTFTTADDVVRAQDVDDRLLAVLSGHIHRRQVVRTARAPVLYAGSTERTSPVEADEPKGFFVIELARPALTAADVRFHTLSPPVPPEAVARAWRAPHAGPPDAARWAPPAHG